MAVLFADICGSTRLYHKLGDAAARTVVAECVALMLDEVNRYEGRLIKTIGDEIMCVFPDTDRGVRAASAMQHRVSQARPGGYPISIHVGLHYGPVVLDAGDVYGNTVNAAAYLTAVSAAEQILLTEAAAAALSPELRVCTRPIFAAPLKGTDRESTVYQVLWKTDNSQMTDVSFGTHKVIPGDQGALNLDYHDGELRMDQHCQSITMGREESCDIVVADRLTSRIHATIELQRTHFYLVDQSTNGTYVKFEDGEEVVVLRRQLLLDRTGRISLGRSIAATYDNVIKFKYDRRALYRILPGAGSAAIRS